MRITALRESFSSLATGEFSRKGKIEVCVLDSKEELLKNLVLAHGVEAKGGFSKGSSPL